MWKSYVSPALLRSYRRAVSSGSRSPIKLKVVTHLLRKIHGPEALEPLLQAIDYQARTNPCKSSGSFHGFIDEIVVQRQGLSYQLHVTGWLFHVRKQIVSLQIYSEQGVSGPADIHRPRPEVAQTFAHENNAYYSGFHVVLPLRNAPDTALSLVFRAVISDNSIQDGRFEAVHLSRRSKFDSDNEGAILPATTDGSQVCQLAFTQLLRTNTEIQFPEYRDIEISIFVSQGSSAANLLACLRSLQRQNDIPFELSVLLHDCCEETRVLLERVRGVSIINRSGAVHGTQVRNQAAQQARGKYLLFIDADIELLDDTLRMACQTASAMEQCGVLGARIVDHHANLLEAGGIIANDGRLRFFGVGSRADLSSAGFLRDIHFCSGSFLLTTSALFAELAGFYQGYGTKLYQDADLCARAASCGAHVIYCPGSIGLCNASKHPAVRELDSTVALSDREVFSTRHMDLLLQQLPYDLDYDLFGFDASNAGVRLLYILPEIPNPNQSLDSARSRKIIDFFLEQGAYVSVLICGRIVEADAINRCRLPERVELVCTVSDSELDGFLQQRSRFYSHVMVCGPQAMLRFNNSLERISSGETQFASVVYECVRSGAVEHLEERSERIAPPMALDMESFRNSEIVLSRTADSVVTWSESEAELFAKENKQSCHVLHVNHDATAFSSSLTALFQPLR